MNEPIQLVPTKSDIEVAAELKKELQEACKPWEAACTKAARAGFIVQASFGSNAIYPDKCELKELQLIKQF